MTGRIIHGDATPGAWADPDEWVEVEGMPVGALKEGPDNREAAGPSLSAAVVPPLGTPAALAYVELVKAKECYAASKEWFRMAEAHLKTATKLLEAKNA